MRPITPTTPATQPTASAPASTAFPSSVVPALLVRITQEVRHAEQLLRLYSRRKPGPEREAILSGHIALKFSAEHALDRLRDFGGLLFYSSPNALRTARAELAV